MEKSRNIDGGKQQVGSELAIGRQHGGAGLAEPVLDPVRVEDERGRQQEPAGRRPAGDNLPLLPENHRGRQRQHQLWLHKGEAQGKPAEVGPPPKGDRRPDPQRDDAVELRVQQQQGRRDGGEAGQHQGGRTGADREVEATGKAEEPEQDPDPAAEVGPEGVERDGQHRHPCRSQKRQDPLDAERHQDAPAGDLSLRRLLRVQVIEMARIRDDQTGPGGERGPVRVDDVVVGQ